MLGRRLFQAAVIMAGLALAYLSVAVILANAAAVRAPQFALSLWPDHAAANANAAERIIQENPRRPRLEEASRYAVAALRRDPTVAGAARNLALRAALQSDAGRAVRLMEYGATMSRRDIPTQLWLLEQRVARNDVEGALHYYAVVLQISPPMREPLYRVLTGALRERDLVRPIARLAKQGESWRSGFVTYVVGNAADPADAVSLFAALNELGEPVPPSLVGILVPRLLAQGKTDAAARLHSLIDRNWRRTDIGSQLDGDFRAPVNVPPFGWTLDPAAASLGVRPGAAAGDQALLVSLSESGTKTVARRLLLLPPGPLQIAGSYGLLEPGTNAILHIDLTCADGRSGGTVAVPIRSDGRFSRPLAMPDCDLQWLALRVERQGAAANVGIWIDGLRLTRAAAHDRG
jgi:hypothetical protein